MSAIEFLITYSIASAAMFAGGYLIGRTKAQTEAERIRRWWYNRDNR
jgi:hypothetical protein